MKRARLRLSREELAAHRRVWQAMIPKRGSIWDVPGFKRSLLSLVKQGYVLEDIGGMFGVSRERVRQWLQQCGVRIIDKRWGSCRLWDWSRRCFIAVPWRVRASQQKRPCRCGCGMMTGQTWAYGHARKGCRVSAAQRRVLCKAAQRRWDRTSVEERQRIGRRISRTWQAKSTKEIAAISEKRRTTRKANA